MNEFSKYVRAELLKDIQKKFNIKTKYEAEILLWEAISRNVVQSEIIDMIDYIKENEE